MTESSALAMSTSTGTVLSSEATERLIQLYREHACLWRVGDTFYKNRYARDDALRAIAQELKLSVSQVKHKINNLRTQYHHYRRANLKRRAANPLNRSIQVKWRWYTALNFLSDASHSKAGLSNLDEDAVSNLRASILKFNYFCVYVLYCTYTFLISSTHIIILL